MALLETRTDIEHRVDVLARRGVYPHGRVLCLRKEVAQSSDARVGRGGILRSGKGEDAPAAIRLDHMSEMNQPRVRQTNDRRGMKAHANRKPRGQMLIGRLAGEDRRTVMGRGSRRVAPVPDEIALRLRRVEPFT